MDVRADAQSVRRELEERIRHHTLSAHFGAMARAAAAAHERDAAAEAHHRTMVLERIFVPWRSLTHAIITGCERGVYRPRARYEVAPWPNAGLAGAGV